MLVTVLQGVTKTLNHSNIGQSLCTASIGQTLVLAPFGAVFEMGDLIGH
jgi:hypothetical protein